MNLLREFRPALIFLAKFLGIYFVGNILYGIYVEAYNEAPDEITRSVTAQTSWILNQLGYDATWEDADGMSKVALKDGSDVVLFVFEGCNGVNVMIVFIAFLFAFGGLLRPLSMFALMGIVVIHLFNLLRIGFLFNLALSDSTQFYYYHKYFFTATLYFIVFVLWVVWVIRFNEQRSVKATV